ncbi:MAG TPA: 4,5-DOPA dioxygenase extradiol [Kouleothrix sp.]|uniref:4,5-DOPA-extradiol-dioxygenase n=1 Tax=Kouleothrix sp. TaxID=2779161 RepID=UPI002C10D83A|nr:4,5-DOPA dioxygenase extradiol [Kouleothrix sp.]HRC77341.1 4,5-DOPA dioxygenase extradiol [Kouleothrix sp.]
MDWSKSVKPAGMRLHEFGNLTDTFAATEKMPLLFVGHGNPMLAITDNVFKHGWQELGRRLPHPKAILCISAHWLTRGTFVTMADPPRTIHDFGGFPQALYDEQYPAPGAVDYARMTIENVKRVAVHEDYDWGLDHGAWCVLKPMFPEGDIPIFQLSIDATQPPQYHYELARELAFLRGKGVLIVSSGNVVHNLRMMRMHGSTYDWAVEFDAIVKDKLEAHDDQPLIEYQRFGRVAQLAVPTNDHYLPLMYTLGLRDASDELSFFNDEFDLGSLSMRSVILK